MNDEEICRIICPYFIRKTKTEIVCEALGTAESVRFTFADAAARQAWQRDVCAAFAYGKRCAWAETLERFYEESL